MGSCAIPLGEVGTVESKFVGVYNSAVTGTFAAVTCASLTLVTVTGGVALCGKRTIGAHMYVFSLVLANAIQVACFCATWGMRIWCPGMMTDEYCRVVLTLGSISEAAASFFFTYLVLDRICELGGICENPKCGTKSGSSLKGSLWVCFVAWSSALIIGCPALSGKTLHGKPGMIPICEFDGTDGIMYLMLHTTVVYVVPALILMMKNIEARRRAESVAMWTIMRKACIFYTVYFILVVPVLLAKTASYMNRDVPFPSRYDYFEMIGTILYQLRVVDFAFSADVIIDDTKHITDAEKANVDTVSEDKNGDNRDESVPPPLFHGTACELKDFGNKLMNKVLDIWDVFGNRLLNVIIKKETVITPLKDNVHELTASSNSVFGAVYDNKAFADGDQDGDVVKHDSGKVPERPEREYENVGPEDNPEREYENVGPDRVNGTAQEIVQTTQPSEPQVMTELPFSPPVIEFTHIGESFA